MSGELVRIERLALGGDGIGRLGDGRTVFVPRTAPGDLVELAQVRRYRRFARARIARLEEASSDRVAPPCPHYVRDDCGGCQLQHATPDAQRRARQSFVGDALRRIGRFDIDDPPIVQATADWAYRTKLTLHARAQAIGLHPLDDGERVFDLETCLITSTALVELWQVARRHRDLLPVGLVRVILRLDRSQVRHLILDVDVGAPWDSAAAFAARLADAGVPTTLWVRADGRTAPAAGKTPGAFPVTAFEQVHPEMGDIVRRWAVEQAGDLTGKHVWDLYAGTGATTTALVTAGATVESIESDVSAVDYAAATGPIEGVRRIAGRAEAMIHRLRPPDVIITNPPRTGMDGVVTTAVAASGAGRIVYVSCDPATLARDLQRLGPGYRIAELRAFDLFPQTAHVETVAVVDRA